MENNGLYFHNECDTNETTDGEKSYTHTYTCTQDRKRNFLLFPEKMFYLIKHIKNTLRLV